MDREVNTTYVIISSRNLHKYADSINFPIEILQQASERVACVADRDEFMRLASGGYLIGVGSWRKIKRVRLNELTPGGHIPLLDAGPVVVEDDGRGRAVGGVKYTYTETLPRSGRKIIALKRYVEKTGQFCRW